MIMFDTAKDRRIKLQERLLIDVNSTMNEIAESPEKLTKEIAINIYNNFPNKRPQIYGLYFVNLKSLDEWLAIYRLSGDKDLSKHLAKKNLETTDADMQDWIILFEGERDDFLQELANKKIRKSCQNFTDALRLYEISSYGFEIKDFAMSKLRENAKSLEEWKTLYALAPFDSQTKTIALQNMLLLAKPKEKNAQEPIKSIVQSKAYWLDEYKNQTDIYSSHKDNALINAYITANYEL